MVYDNFPIVKCNRPCYNISMSRYTLKTYCGDKQLEVFEHRTLDKLNGILQMPKHHMPGETDQWGKSLRTADRFEISNSAREKLFSGNIGEAISAVKYLRKRNAGKLA